SVYDKKDTLNLNAEQKMLLEETYKGFVRSGAELNDTDKLELRDINERLSKLSTKFKTNTVNATKEYKKIITDENDLAGVPERAKNMYRQMAEEAGEKGKFMIRLSPPPSDIFEYAD